MVKSKTEKYKARRAYLRIYQKEWLKKRRMQWIKENGPCAKCGSNRNLEADHIDPKKKSFHISQIWSRRKDILFKELAKCQVLCKPCHLKKTINDMSKSDIGIYRHGTCSMYQDHKCRCIKCRKWNAERSAKQKKRKKKEALVGLEPTTARGV